MLENKKKNKEMKSSRVFHPVSTFKMVRSKFLLAKIIYMFKMEKFLHTKTIYVKDGKIDHSLSKRIICTIQSINHDYRIKTKGEVVKGKTS